MTATETNTTDRQTDQPGELGELLLVDPATLIVGANVRGVVELDRAFARDIAERGVREPITVRRNPDGELVVRKGKRRTLAAVQAGLTQVRVFVDPGTDPDDGDTAGRIARTIDQLAENDHRAELGAEDRVRAHQELLELGLTAGQIARRTHTPTGRVRAAHAVAGSQLAQAVLAKYELTLDQAAVVAEFDDGSPAGAEAAKLLTVTARNEPAQFAHVAQRVRDDWADARRIAEHTAELTSAGVTVLTEQHAARRPRCSCCDPRPATDPVPNSPKRDTRAARVTPAPSGSSSTGRRAHSCGWTTTAPTPTATGTRPATTAAAADRASRADR